MANPVMNRIDKEVAQMSRQGRTPNGYPAMPGYQPGGNATSGVAQQVYRQGQNGAQSTTGFPQAQRYPQQQYPEQGQPQYQSGPVAEADALPLTMDDVITKTGVMFGVLLVAAGATWVFTSGSQQLASAAMMIGFLGGMILALVNIFKSQPSPALMLAYAGLEGVALGALSMVMNFLYPGVVLQAVAATFVVFGVTLALFKSGKVRMTPGLNKFLLIGLFGVIGFALVSLILNWTGLVSGSLYEMQVFGIPLGILVSLFAIVLGAISLIQDFTVAEHAVRAGLPKQYAWTCAFGLIVTLVWLYVEILRLLSYLQRD